MVKQRFTDFWAAQKTINEVIFYGPSRDFTDIYLLEEVGFVGESCQDMYVSGSYNCRDGSMAVNFYLKGVGPVKRYCLNGKEHGDAGRFHEHILRKDSDASGMNNLPYAIPRPDLEGLEPEVAWRKICAEGSISHTDTFNDPRGWCK